MKSISSLALSEEKSATPENKIKHAENAKKIAQLLTKRREMQERQRIESENEKKKKEKPREKHPLHTHRIKEIPIELKNEIPAPEFLSEEYDDDDDQPEIITDNSDCFESNGSLNSEITAKDTNTDESSSEDDEITWSCLQRSQKQNHEKFVAKYDGDSLNEDHKKSEQRKSNSNNDHLHHKQHAIPPIAANPSKSCGAASLDRRQRSRSQSHRRERDSKSRSTHSLREKYSRDSKPMIADKLSRDHHFSSCSNRRMSPTWEIPPPPPFQPWEYHRYKRHNMSSNEDLREMQFYRCPCDPYRVNSCQELYHQSQLSLAANCENTYYPYGPPPCCANHYYSPQRQDTASDRVRRLQSDKESLQLQVQILTEQIDTQNAKMKEMETTLNEKSHQLNATEDLLNREMLSRSSLETQKLELITTMTKMKLQQAALERENFELRSTYQKNGLTNLNNTSLLKRFGTTGSQGQQQNINQKNNNTLSGSHGNLSQNLSIANTSSPEFNRQRADIHYSSLPRQSFAQATVLSVSEFGVVNRNGQDSTNDDNIQKRNVAFADDDKIIDDSIIIPQRSYAVQALTSPAMGQRHKGLRGIFDKIKQNNSNNMSLVEDSSNDTENDFVRGGIRATAGPRLGWSYQEKIKKPFREWNAMMICGWFEELGLDYVNEYASKWLQSGEDLLKAAPQDIDKELNLKTHLHRKKILLALSDIADQDADEMLKNAGKLDTTWVLRWLDDIGLPQHKDEFFAARIDGRVLHRLTMDDLVTMHITACLHVASLRRGIQLLREQNFNPDCLIRRLDEIGKDKVVCWTSHCIMEWLRMVDLAEYAPNLRGSGVHGSLMVNEIKFNAELLADLLCIPASKTLLRRHLQTHFKDLIGRDVIQLKRDAENTLGYVPLTITGKIKTPKKSQFSLKRKKSVKNDDPEFTNYVCPMTGIEELDDNGNDSRTSNSSVRSCFTAN